MKLNRRAFTIDRTFPFHNPNHLKKIEREWRRANEDYADAISTRVIKPAAKPKTDKQDRPAPDTLMAAKMAVQAFFAPKTKQFQRRKT